MPTAIIVCEAQNCDTSYNVNDISE